MENIEFFLVQTLKGIRISFILIRNLLVWLCPFLFFLVVIIVIGLYFHPTLAQYLELLKVLIWPVTILIGLFFFRKVFTYMFFSMDGFDFFGAEGTLKNVGDLIKEKVDQKFLEEKADQERKSSIEKTALELSEKQKKIDEATGTAEGNLNLAREVLKSWRESEEENKKSIAALQLENNALKEQSFFKNNFIEPPVINSPSDLGSGEKVGDPTPVENSIQNHE